MSNYNMNVLKCFEGTDLNLNFALSVQGAFGQPNVPFNLTGYNISVKLEAQNLYSCEIEEKTYVSNINLRNIKQINNQILFYLSAKETLNYNGVYYLSLFISNSKYRKLLSRNVIVFNQNNQFYL